MFAQNIQHVVLVLQKDWSPRLRQRLSESHRTLETSARKIEDMLLLTLLLQHGERQSERSDVRDVRNVGAVHILLLGRHVAYGHAQRAIYLLGFSASSRRALYKKLVSKGFDPEYSRIALDRLSDNGLLCEADSAIREAEKCASKLWGEERIRAALFEKGYSDESISTAFFALEDSGVDFDENCLSLIKKKYSSLPTDKKELQKIISSLMRYGYSLSQIKRAIALGR